MANPASNLPIRSVYTDPGVVASVLADLDLGEGTIIEAVQTAFADSFACTEHDVPAMRGLLAWGRTVRYLRDQLVPRGWTSNNDRNYSVVVHPSGVIAVAVASGDASTGIPDRIPSTLHEKGPATVEAVLGNQLSFADVTAYPGGPSRLRTWIVLFYFDETLDEIRVELALPEDISKEGKVTSWKERVILRPIAISPPSLNEISEPDIDVPVTRRTV